MPDRFSSGQSWPIGFGATCLRALLYILLIAGVMQGVYHEALQQPEVRFSERGFTELTQSVVLLTASALLLYTRQVFKALPTVTLLLFAFVFSSLIREQDAHLDTYVFDGAWQLLVGLVVLPCLFLVIRRRHNFVDEFARYANSFSFGLFAAGFLTTYVFSRLYGRSEVWMAILGERYERTFKDAAEEVVELFGYTLILIAIVELALLARRWHRARLAARKD
ncbi:hypothetical protein KG088_13920 [Halomonas sp. TRM85114]|uniref:hypothetical protein n=1 Tax=Halomonas jincaotanensis TaxID=2810616 RepID=UPI001BD584C4|nr:hypothetical protein [Halomonas jincaotanensis]MBS9404734.1 hypothetical protein [Halomonas jincaotanensis]